MKYGRVLCNDPGCACDLTAEVVHTVEDAIRAAVEAERAEIAKALNDRIKYLQDVAPLGEELDGMCWAMLLVLSRNKP